MKGDRELIEKILEYIGDIEEDIVDCQDIETFLEKKIYFRSCITSLIQIGELVKRLSPEITNNHNEVEWSKIARLRDYLVHGYVKVEPLEIWNDVTEDVPELKEQLIKILSKND